MKLVWEEYANFHPGHLGYLPILSIVDAFTSEKAGALPTWMKTKYRSSEGRDGMQIL